MVEKNKIMLVTSGISLFESASWLPGEWMRDIPEYKRWLKEGTSNNPGPLISPSKRIRDEKSNKIYAFFQNSLTADNAAEWAIHFAKDVNPKPYTLRYSAELSSIIDFAMKKAKDWKNYLNQYHIQLITDGSDQSLSHIAAVHNLKYLQTIGIELGDNKIKPIPGISSTIADELKSAFDYLKEYFSARYRDDKYKEMVIVISGGFKIYPLAFAEIFCGENDKTVKIIYRYEEGDQILELEKIPEIIPFDKEENKEQPKKRKKIRPRICIADSY